MFYNNFSDETCVSLVSEMFKDLGHREKVSACLAYDKGGVSYEGMLAIHNHLESSKIWRKTVPWVTEVEYTIPHPDGDITAFDSNSGGEAKLTRNSVVLQQTGSCKNWKISLTRILAEPSDKMDFNTTRWTWVKVKNTKKFYYETERSSWVFKLAVCWEGVTKEVAKAGDKKYLVYVESVGSDKTCSYPSYSAASFLDKILDIISLDGKRPALTF